MTEDGLQLRCKYQERAIHVVVQRLLTHSIPSYYERSSLPIPDCKSKHPTQILDTILAILLIRMNEDFGIGGGIDFMALGNQVLADRHIIIDLPVQYDPDDLIFIVDRLVTGLEIDDTQPPHAECHMVHQHHAFIVRPSVLDAVTHCLQDRSVVPVVIALSKDKSGYTTHLSARPTSFGEKMHSC